jgi:hypothetical protein
MIDERVDDVLADLDRVLAVEPSPSLNARVRSAWQRSPEHHALSPRYVAAGILVMLMASVPLWRRVPERASPDVAPRASTSESVVRPEPDASMRPSAQTAVPSREGAGSVSELSPVVKARRARTHDDQANLLRVPLIEVRRRDRDPLIRIPLLTISPLDVRADGLQGKS